MVPLKNLLIVPVCSVHVFSRYFLNYYSRNNACNAGDSRNKTCINYPMCKILSCGAPHHRFTNFTRTSTCENNLWNSSGALPYGQKLSVFFKNGVPQKDPTNSESMESIERNVNGLHQTDIRIRLRDKSFRLWDLFEGEKWRYPVCRIWVPHVSVYGRLFSVCGKLFSVEGK